MRCRCLCEPSVIILAPLARHVSSVDPTGPSQALEASAEIGYCRYRKVIVKFRERPEAYTPKNVPGSPAAVPDGRGCNAWILGPGASAIATPSSNFSSPIYHTSRCKDRPSNRFVLSRFLYS